jgi:serine/threonine protein kinase
MSHDATTFEVVAREICVARKLAFGSLVGSGAFKHTFQVTKGDGVQLALKVYKADSERTAREVSAITRCNHENIAKFHELGNWTTAATSYTFSIEEFLAGGTLSGRLTAGALDATALANLARSLAAAVEHMAGLNLVHRDIKPDNIMFRTAAGPLVLVDFGIVRDLKESSMTQTWAMRGPGSPYFAAPEQLNNDKDLIDWRTDQFGLGVVVTIAATGSHPYASALGGNDPMTVIDRVANRVGPASWFTDWAKGARMTWLVRALSPWPVSRFTKPADLLAVLAGEI